VPTRVVIPEEIRQQILEKSNYRCGYCQAPQTLLYAKLQIDHIIPLAAGGNNNPDNLWASCDPCNAHKSQKTQANDPITKQAVQLFNPQTQMWDDHFNFDEDRATILGLTAIGRATVIRLYRE
jgi:5-methylcytosine-specific restriction endonuclease McrA